MVFAKATLWIIVLILSCIKIKVGICWLLPVHVNSRSHFNYYYVSMDIGTPPQQISLLIDTSSSHTYINPPKHYYEYQSNESSTFTWLTCMDAEHCNICLSNSRQCGWEFACEQTYIMGKDIIHLNNYSDINENQVGKKKEKKKVDENYFVFGYNMPGINQEDRSHIFSVDDAKNDDLIMGGILSLNRKQTSFIQHMYNSRKMNKIFGHYFNKENGYMAFGKDIKALKKTLNIGNDDISWVQYLDNEESSMYQTNVSEITFSSNIVLNDNQYQVFDVENSYNSNLNILTFDTGITGIGFNHQWKDIVLDYICNISNIDLVENTYYEYCIDTDTTDILDDIFTQMPNINIRLSSNYIYIISPQQYIVNINNDSVRYPFCLDISFDEAYGICLGSQSMENYVILYDDDNKQVGIYDANMNHRRIKNRFDLQDLSEIVEKDEEYIYVLSFVLVGMLICLLLIVAACVILLRKMSKSQATECYSCNVPTIWNDRRRNSIPIDEKLSPQHIDIKADAKQEEIELYSNNSSNASNNANSDINISMSSSLSPLQSYYNGNVKSIVYDRVIKPWDLEEEMNAI